MSIQEMKNYLKVYNLELIVTNLHFKIYDVRGRLLLSSTTWKDVKQWIKER